MRAQQLSRRPVLSLLLLVQLIAITVFVVGPQAGSLDDDGDGNPDVPVVVSALRGAEDLGCVPRYRGRALDREPAKTGLPADADCVQANRQSSSASQHRLLLSALCLLRC